MSAPVRPPDGFVGREADLERLVDALASGSHVLVRGPVGIGKTRLVREALSTPVMADRTIDRLVASPATAPYRLGALAAAGVPDDVDAGDVPALMAWYVGRWRVAATDGAPPLVWLDDAPHADELSAAVLRQAATTGAAHLVLTQRTPDELPADLRALAGEGLLVVHDVEPLDEPSSDLLARSVTRDRLDAERLRRVHELARGYPLFIVNLAPALLEDPSADAALRSLDLVVGARLRTLPPPRRRVAELVAAAGQLPVGLLQDDRDAVAGLEASGVLRRRGNHATLEHPLYASWLLADLGERRAEVYGELVRRAASLEDAADLDDVVLADWLLQAGQQVPVPLAERATRLALARSDGTAALRFVEHTDGPATQLWRGQALILAGRLDEGLAALDLARRLGPPRLRVEAANWSARYLGVMLRRHDEARAALAEVADVAEDEPALARAVLNAKLWLWMFGAPDDPTLVERAEALVDADDDPVSAYSLATLAAGLMPHVGAPSAADGLLRTMRRIEAGTTLSTQVLSRGRSIQAWDHLFSGRASTGVAVLLEQFERALVDRDAESLGLLAGTGGFALALAGRPARALELHSAVRHLRDGLDWFRMFALERAVALGNACLAGGDPAPDRAAEIRRDARDGTADLEAVLAARALALHRQRAGLPDPDAVMLVPLARLGENRKAAWVAVISSEVLSAGSPADVHRRVVETCEGVADEGVTVVARDLALARLERDPSRLLRAAATLERFGYVAPALRAYGDVVQAVEPGGPRHARAVQGLVRALRTWDAPTPWWLATADGLPSARQREVADRLLGGATVQDVADELVLSRRTVENHVYRTCRALGVSGQDELVAVLAPLGAEDAVPRGTAAASP